MVTICKQQKTILLVDDDHQVLEMLLFILTSEGYRVVTATNGAEALERIRDRAIDMVITDIRMPVMDGLELAAAIHLMDPAPPVLVMTAFAEIETVVGALKEGAFDFIFKPISPDLIIHSVKKAATFSDMKAFERNYRQALEEEVARKTEELVDLNREIIRRLTTVSEFRDTDTGLHISRIGKLTGLLARTLGLADDFVETLILASSLHDIGKVAIPDSILLKRGSLTPEEFGVIKSHTVIGAKILSGSRHRVLHVAESVALTHHEHWDGSGYPQGLKGDVIPIEGRIVIVADQYDALRARRPYKDALGHEESCRILFEGRGGTRPEHFDPVVMGAFRGVAAEFQRVFEEMDAV